MNFNFFKVPIKRSTSIFEVFSTTEVFAFLALLDTYDFEPNKIFFCLDKKVKKAGLVHPNNFKMKFHVLKLIHWLNPSIE